MPAPRNILSVAKPSLLLILWKVVTDEESLSNIVLVKISCIHVKFCCKLILHTEASLTSLPIQGMQQKSPCRFLCEIV